MKATITCLTAESADKFENSARKPTRTLFDIGSYIVNKFLHAIETSNGRQQLRDLNRRLLDDIGVTPFDRDQLVG
jgi:uncharacterized protein YjiS (DUF1127 family)